MKQKILSLVLVGAALTMHALKTDACTGITLKSKNNCHILARTIEWGGSELNSQYVVVPRGYEQQSYTPSGKTDGLKFKAAYGYVGLAVEQKEFVAEGLNEEGLSAGLFYFPRYGQYETLRLSTSLALTHVLRQFIGVFQTFRANKLCWKSSMENLISMTIRLVF